MNKIEAIIRPPKLDEVKQALVNSGVTGLTVTSVHGFRRRDARTRHYRGCEYTTDFADKLKLEIIVQASNIDVVVQAISKAARTSEIGDGKILVTPIEQIVRIRTSDVDMAAI